MIEKECEVYGMINGLHTLFDGPAPKNGGSFACFLVKMMIDISVYRCIQ